MKTRVLFIVIVMAIFGFTNCSDDEASNSIENNFGDLQAEIDGVLRVFPVVSGAAYNEFNNQISIYTYNGDIEISLLILFPPVTGTYDLSNNESHASVTFGDPFDIFDQNGDGPAITFPAVDGYVTITELDEERVVGVFEFTGELEGTGQHSVKEGEFNILRQ
ncbi:hypothetical protein [Algibacter aquimarinus]|uniref:Uncharacterized protein n=1 Tax=Algibacter aquimarinus TaxID=1136748 RepID=A0ABP9H864_9FLAO